MGHYTSACLTQIAYIHHGDGTILLSAATDGHLAFWADSQSSSDERPRKMSCLGTQSLHQSSIKSLSTCKLNDNTSLVVTGGDDNGLGITLIRFNQPKDVKCHNLIIPRAHVAAITATSIVAVIDKEHTGSHLQIRVATASNDQRVRLWNIDVDLTQVGVEGLEVTRGANRYSAVADVSSMALFPCEGVSQQRGNKILICGVGMEIWDVET